MYGSPDARDRALKQELEAIDRTVAETGQTRQDAARSLASTFRKDIAPSMREYAQREYWAATPLPKVTSVQPDDTARLGEYRDMKSRNPFLAVKFRQRHGDEIGRAMAAESRERDATPKRATNPKPINFPLGNLARETNQ